MAALSPWGANVTGNGEAERIQGVRLTGNALETLGARAAAGRLLGVADAEPQASRTVVLTHGFWLRRFAGNPNAVGKTLDLNGEAYAIAGVLEPHFFFPGFPDAEIAISLSLQGDERRNERGSNFLRAFGRLATGSTSARAQEQLAAADDALRRRYPEDNAKLAAPRVLPLERELTESSRATLLLLLAAVGLLLTIACANIAAMMLVRSLRRSREIAVKKALGASSARLMGEAMTEMSLLAAVGGAASLAVAAAMRPALDKLRPQTLPPPLDEGLGLGLLLFTAGVVVVTAMACALGPAVSAHRVAPITGLKDAAGGPGRSARRMRNLFVLGQIALSLVLLSGAALLLESLGRLLTVSPGFDPRNVLVVRLSLPRAAYPTAESARRFFERVEDNLRLVPGITASGAASVTPLSGANNRTDFEIVGRPAATVEETPGAQNRWVEGDYFKRCAFLSGADVFWPPQTTAAPGRLPSSTKSSRAVTGPGGSHRLPFAHHGDRGQLARRRDRRRRRRRPAHLARGGAGGHSLRTDGADAGAQPRVPGKQREPGRANGGAALAERSGRCASDPLGRPGHSDREPSNARPGAGGRPRVAAVQRDARRALRRGSGNSGGSRPLRNALAARGRRPP